MVKKYWKLIVAVVGCELVGLAATTVTITAIPTWYAGLNKPPFSPPNFIFGSVWTMIYFLMGVALFLVWQKGFKKKVIRTAVLVFSLQLGLNFLWSIIFFGAHSPILALVEIIFLWGAIAVTIARFIVVSKPAAYLLVPYILWVSLAAVLNGSIVVLNP